MEEDARRMSSQNIFKAQLPFKQPNHFWTQILCSLSDAGESFPQQRQQRWQKTFVDAAVAVAVAAAAWLEACFLCSPVCLPRRCTCSASHFPLGSPCSLPIQVTELQRGVWNVLQPRSSYALMDLQHEMRTQRAESVTRPQAKPECTPRNFSHPSLCASGIFSIFINMVYVYIIFA